MKRLLVFLMCCTMDLSLNAQETYTSSGKAGGYHHKTKKGYDPDKLILGGGLNLGYSGDYANVGISPRIGYKFNNYLAAGFGLGYQYYKTPDFTVGNKIYYLNEHIVFPSVWAKLKVFNPFYLSADIEYDFINLVGYTPYYDPQANLNFKRSTAFAGAPCMLVGAGIRQPLGGRAALTFEIMYDVLQADYSPYREQLVYRGGIFVGF